MSFGVVGNTSRVNVKAPDLGSFPLDHYRECKDEIVKYYSCMKENKYIAPRCRDEVREYLTCRMDRGLMKKADIKGFGLPETEFVATLQHKQDIKEQWSRQNMTGVNPLYVERFKRDDLNVPDGYEVERATQRKILPTLAIDNSVNSAIESKDSIHGGISPENNELESIIAQRSFVNRMKQMLSFIFTSQQS